MIEAIELDRHFGDGSGGGRNRDGGGVRRRGVIVPDRDQRGVTIGKNGVIDRDTHRGGGGSEAVCGRDGVSGGWNNRRGRAAYHSGGGIQGKAGWKRGRDRIRSHRPAAASRGVICDRCILGVSRRITGVGQRRRWYAADRDAHRGRRGAEAVRGRDDVSGGRSHHRRSAADKPRGGVQRQTRRQCG